MGCKRFKKRAAIGERKVKGKRGRMRLEIREIYTQKKEGKLKVSKKTEVGGRQT